MGGEPTAETLDSNLIPGQVKPKITKSSIYTLQYLHVETWKRIVWSFHRVW